ncbi:MAG TPA: winged helix-turn-helix domain-containing protein [Terriglobales bacterium]|nr:winged helix-turn-helix domain-containing protein [Terriglobales bacterium]
MSANPRLTGKGVYEFGPFRVDPEKEVLLRGCEPVPLTPKTFQILLVLIRHSTEVVTKDDLMKAVWPDTFVEEANLSRNIFLLRKALGDNPQERFILTVPGRGYRLAENVHLVPERELSIVAASHSRVEVQVKESWPWPWILAALLAASAAAVGTLEFLAHRRPPLTEKDTIVLADFANSTGDPVFDDALRQGMAVQLEQSPFLTLISDRRIQTTLRLMGQPADTRLNPRIAEEVCERTSSTAALEGSIARLGSQYVLGLQAKVCSTGQIIAEEQVQAARKEDVLKALDSAAVSLRGKLGESLSSVRKYDTPVDEASTSSLEALKAYSQGRRIMLARGYTAAVPFYQHAVELDPNFALAYRNLSASYLSLNQDGRTAEMARKAYELRSKVSERERFSIEGTYHLYATGNLEKATQIYQSWQQIYPRDYIPALYLGNIYSCLGDWEKALQEREEARRLEPGSAVTYAITGEAYTNLNRLAEAAAVFKLAEERKFENENLSTDYYAFAFAKGDVALQDRLAAAAMGKPGVEDAVLAMQANTEAWFGRMLQARELTRRAMNSAMQHDAKESAAGYEAEEALNEAELGYREQARTDAKAAIRLSPNHDVRDVAMLALAEAGDSQAAEQMVLELGKTYPEDTLIQTYWIPTVHAAIELNRGDSARAIELLQSMGARELGQPTPFAILLHPVYVRGEAFLAEHKGAKAAVEFHKILDHNGLMQNDPIGALARLQLGRAYTIQGNFARAIAAYRDFLASWSGADPNVPILKQAKAEYEKLQQAPRPLEQNGRVSKQSS